MNVNYNKYTFIKSIKKDKVAENTLLILYIKCITQKIKQINKYICQGVAPGLESI